MSYIWLIKRGWFESDILCRYDVALLIWRNVEIEGHIAKNIELKWISPFSAVFSDPS